jgi:hypothetical protein
MDDVILLISTTIHNTTLHQAIQNHTQHHLYDQTHKNLTLKKQNTTVFLDCDTILYNNNHNFKITYNNKNKNITSTKLQTVGRFHHAHAYSHIKHKLAAAQNITTRIFDYTTDTSDMILPTLELILELHTLKYNKQQIINILHKTNRSRPSHTWTTIRKIISI